MTTGKGSKRRKGDNAKAFRKNFNSIFRKTEKKKDARTKGLSTRSS